jgi:hypothetical protein
LRTNCQMNTAGWSLIEFGQEEDSENRGYSYYKDCNGSEEREESVLVARTKT